MDLSTISRLAELNRQFYAEHAENFADARPRLPAGVQRVLAGIAPGARVLEVGCGDGKVGRALARAGVGAYVGLDSSAAMLERAERYTTKDERRRTKESLSTKLTRVHEVVDEQPVNGEPQTPRPNHPRDQAKTNEGPGMNDETTAPPSVLRPSSFVYILSDLVNPTWPSALPPTPFDWVLAFAVFHHLPGFDLRAGVLEELAVRLAPGGRVALSCWQFTRSQRLKQRIVPWAEAGLSASDVEPGDYLLSWERKGTRGLRYVHVLDPTELIRAATEAGLRIVETFSADGVSGDLSDYAVMARAS